MFKFFKKKHKEEIKKEPIKIYELDFEGICSKCGINSAEKKRMYCREKGGTECNTMVTANYQRRNLCSDCVVEEFKDYEIELILQSSESEDDVV